MILSIICMCILFLPTLYTSEAKTSEEAMTVQVIGGRPYVRRVFIPPERIREEVCASAAGGLLNLQYTKGEWNELQEGRRVDALIAQQSWWRRLAAWWNDELSLELHNRFRALHTAVVEYGDESILTDRSVAHALQRGGAPGICASVLVGGNVLEIMIRHATPKDRMQALVGRRFPPEVVERIMREGVDFTVPRPIVIPGREAGKDSSRAFARRWLPARPYRMRRKVQVMSIPDVAKALDHNAESFYTAALQSNPMLRRMAINIVMHSFMCSDKRNARATGCSRVLSSVSCNPADDSVVVQTTSRSLTIPVGNLMSFLQHDFPQLWREKHGLRCFGVDLQGRIFVPKCYQPERLGEIAESSVEDELEAEGSEERPLRGVGTGRDPLFGGSLVGSDGEDDEGRADSGESAATSRILVRRAFLGGVGVVESKEEEGSSHSKEVDDPFFGTL